MSTATKHADGVTTGVVQPADTEGGGTIIWSASVDRQVTAVVIPPGAIAWLIEQLQNNLKAAPSAVVEVAHDHA
jgi:hypothetical protein